MTETFRLIRVFLASPGDLQDERRLAKDAIDEINKQIAPRLGFRVELMAWEETLPGYGRPQDIINQELDICELFIGMMWKKWGTPPAVQSSYSSGFEEEFERSFLRREETGKPEIAIFFKEVDPAFLYDPGDDLKKVIEFQDRLELEKAILYKKFKDSYELQGYVREKVTQYLIDLEKSIIENQEKERAKSKKPIEENEQTQNQEPVKSPFSAEGHSFLKGFIEKTEAENSAENITPLEVARFRLLATTISKSGNNEPFLGVHDANIIYSNKNDVVFGKQEISKLVDCGLKNIEHSNVPLWHWYSLNLNNMHSKEFFLFETLGFSEKDRCIGALKVIRLVGTKLPVGTNLNRAFFIKRWFSSDASNNVKLSALSYLKLHGLYEDLPFIQTEFDMGDSQTAKSSIETILSIMLRSNGKEAAETALKTQFETIDNKLIKQVVSGELSMDDDLLRLGLKHRNAEVRLACINKLKNDDKLTLNDAKTLADDDVASVRSVALYALLSQNQLLSDVEIRNILVKPKGQRAGGLLSGLTSAHDEEGEKYHNNYLSTKLFKMDEKSLVEITKSGSIYNDLPYFVLCERYFNKYSDQLRKVVEDQFKSYFDNHMKSMEERYSNKTSDTLQKTRDLEMYLRQNLVRKGLDVLCRIGHADDLARVQKNIRSGFTKSSVSEIKYFKKMGEWDDIPYIIKAEENHTTSRRASFSTNDSWHSLIADAIYNLGSSRLEELLSMVMPDRVFIKLINICAITKFSQLSNDIIFTMLNNEKDDIRKSCSLKCIQSFKKSKLKAILNDYISRDDCRYYNVIHWLDFGVAMPKGITKKAIELISNS